MRFLLDESADSRLAVYLRESGHDVTVIARDYPNALDDVEVLAIAVSEQRILIANDRDFGELVVRRRLPHAGIILFRLDTIDLASKRDSLAWVLAEHDDDLRAGRFLVVTSRSIRVRGPGRLGR